MGGSMISSKLCVRCKGRLFCGLKSCPILEKYAAQRAALSAIETTEFSGSSPPGVFVSWTNWPNVSVAPLASAEILPNAYLYDNPEQWFNLSQEEIISMRSQLISAKEHYKVNAALNPNSRLQDIQELAMAASSVVVDIELKKKPEVKLSFSDFVAPLGPAAPLKNFELAENPPVPAKVDYLVSDTDAKASVAVEELYTSKISVYAISKLLSAGLLGVKKNRILVPTRWSITATDDIISKSLIEKIKSYEQISEYLIFHSYYLDNSYYVLLLPSEWKFEQLEAWYPGSPWSVQNDKEATVISDYEFYDGRKTYADNVTGAYYAARLAVAEYLAKKRKQAGVIIFREIGSNYKVPLGVWQVRENVRNAMKQRPISFSSLDLALKFLETKLSVPLKKYLQESTLLKAEKSQRKIYEFT